MTMKTRKLTKFESIVTRLMTEDEREKLGTKLKLDAEVMGFIHEQFDLVQDHAQDDGDMTEDDVSDAQGRCSLYMDYDSVESDLGPLMGMPDHPTKKQTARVTRVMEAFFTE